MELATANRSAHREGRLTRGLQATLTEEREGVTADDALDRALRGAEEGVDELRRRASNLLDSLANGPSPAIEQRLRETEPVLEEAEGNLRRLQERQEAAMGLTIGARIAKALEALQPRERTVDVAQANRTLRSLFSRAVIEWRAGMIELDWTHGGTMLLPYTTTFRNVSGWTWDEEKKTT